MSRITAFIILSVIILSTISNCSNHLLKCDELDSLTRKTTLLNVCTNSEITELLREKAVKKMKRRGIDTDTNFIIFSVYRDGDIYLLQYGHKDLNVRGGCGIFAFDSLLNLKGYCFGQ